MALIEGRSESIQPPFVLLLNKRNIPPILHKLRVLARFFRSTDRGGNNILPFIITRNRIPIFNPGLCIV